MIIVPEELARTTVGREGGDGRAWIDRLPALAEHYLRRWHCSPDGPVTNGAVALIMPVGSPQGPAVIKISFAHPGNVDEPWALELWQGNGAVRLFDHDPDDFAMLLERAQQRNLDLGVDDAMQASGELLRRLSVPAPPGMPTLASQAPPWEEQLLDQDRRAGHPLPDRLVGAALETIRDLAQDRTPTMLHGDLHAGNILASDRGWLAIDPKGVAGNPAHDAATMMLYRHQEAMRADDIRAELDRRLTIFCDASGADPVWARRLVQARFVSGLLWDHLHGDRVIDSKADLRGVVAELLVQDPQSERQQEGEGIS